MCALTSALCAVVLTLEYRRSHRPFIFRLRLIGFLTILFRHRRKELARLGAPLTSPTGPGDRCALHREPPIIASMSSCCSRAERLTIVKPLEGMRRVRRTCQAMRWEPPGCESRWVDTDGEGRIERFSRSAARLFGLGRLSSGENILWFFPIHQKALKRDIDAALAGWPERRTALVSPLAQNPVVVRYRVSLRVMASHAGLHWVFDILDEEPVPAH
jgi:hypothetical protein